MFLLVITSVLFLTVIATEITHGAAVRIQLAAHQRDEALAEALAKTGFQVYRLILVASKGLGDQFGSIMQQYGLGGDTLWQMVPFINTGMMRMLLVSGNDLEEEDMAQYEAEGLTEEQIAESREEQGSGTKRNFLDFDGEMLENDRAIRLYALMGGEENDQFFYERNIDRWELIGDLADWTDPGDDRLYQGGRETALYENLPSPYKPKNAGFDTMGEVRLVNGWHRDDVWEKFGDELTIYGSGRTNVNTASREGLLALMRAYVIPNTPQFQDLLLTEIQIYKSLATYPNAAGFVRHLESLGATVDPRMTSAIKTESDVFTITSTGEVRGAVVKIVAVVDFSRSGLGTVVQYRVE